MAQLKYLYVTDQRYHMNSLLKFQFDIMINAVKHDFDCVFVIDGEIEGVGKSVLGQQAGYYFSYVLGQPFTIDNIVFDPQEFRKKVLELPQNSVIIWDEAYIGSSKYRVMSGINQTIQSLLQQIRQKNMVIIIIIPYIFDLSMYIAVPRSWFLLHVDLRPVYGEDEEDTISPLDFTKEVFERGYVTFYSRKQKKLLYFLGKKMYNYNAVRNSFIARFPKHYTVDEQEYKKKKADIRTDTRITEKELAMELLGRGMGVPELQKWVKLSKVSLYSYKKKLIS